MSQTEARAIIRDIYGCKHYEIIQLGDEMFIYDYDLGRPLDREETAILKDNLYKQQEIHQ